MKVVDNRSFSYKKREVPETYKCGACGKHGVKLWRYYQTFLEHQELKCACCAIKEYRKKHSYSNDIQSDIRMVESRKEIPLAGKNYPTEEEWEQSLIVNENGCRWGWHYCGRESEGIERVLLNDGDQIGWLIPAVPTEENDTFWGYSSVPQVGVDWWKSLITNKN